MPRSSRARPTARRRGGGARARGALPEHAAADHAPRTVRSVTTPSLNISTVCSDTTMVTLGRLPRGGGADCAASDPSSPRSRRRSRRAGRAACSRTSSCCLRAFRTASTSEGATMSLWKNWLGEPSLRVRARGARSLEELQDAVKRAARRAGRSAPPAPDYSWSPLVPNDGTIVSMKALDRLLGTRAGRARGRVRHDDQEAQRAGRCAPARPRLCPRCFRGRPLAA